MKTKIQQIVFHTTLIAFVLLLVGFYSGTASAQLNSTTTYSTPQAGTPSVDALRYTGSYCPSSVGNTIALGTATLGGLFQFVTCLIERSFIPLLFAIATFVFIYGVVKFIGTEESAEKEDGRQFMIWGIVALAVMFSVWGLVKILGTTFGVNNIIPQLPASAK